MRFCRALGFVVFCAVLAPAPSAAAEPGGAAAAKRARRFAGAVTTLALVNAETGNVIPGFNSIPQNSSFALRRLRSNPVDIRARVRPGRRVGSVLFQLEDRGVRRIRNRAPYRWAMRGWNPQPGEHILSVTPFRRRNARGRAGRAYVLRFIVVNDEAGGQPTPVPVPSGSPAPSPPPFATPTPAVTPPPDDGSPLKAWANEGGDKVAREELRYSAGGPTAVVNSVWDGVNINLFGGRNEVLSFNLVIEAPQRRLQRVSVAFDRLDGPGGAWIGSVPASGDKVFDYRMRNIELFYVRYLQIKGLSRLGYETYDERHVPVRLRRPHNGPGGAGGWQDRPDHDRFYPDIAVPYEQIREFDVAEGGSQSIWADIYVPKHAPPGAYQGYVWIFEAGGLMKKIPVTLAVRDFTLPDTPSAKTMLFMGGDPTLRYLGRSYPQNAAEAQQVTLIRDRHFQMAHRHKISLIDSNDDYGASSDRPSPDWLPRLSGALFQPERGYDGPGVGVGNNVFSIGTYGSWNWATDTLMRAHADAWVGWFDGNSPQTEYFLYLIDEVYDFAKINAWASVLNSHSGPGRRLMSFATIGAPLAAVNAPALDIACSTGGIGVPERWEAARAYYSGQDEKRFCFYNGRRPQSGSFMIEDDGVALRQVAWAQYKLGVQRWFYWESTYYNNFQAGAGQTNVFAQARTFGGYSSNDAVLGETGWNYSNGDGVLFYPGTDRLFSAESYELQGPLASLRLKHWRRGIQDVDYLTLAARAAPERVHEIVAALVPKALWEYGVDDPNDPTWVLTDISWPTQPDQWEEARRRLADIIEGSTAAADGL